MKTYENNTAGRHTTRDTETKSAFKFIAPDKIYIHTFGKSKQITKYAQKGRSPVNIQGQYSSKQVLNGSLLWSENEWRNDIKGISSFKQEQPPEFYKVENQDTKLLERVFLEMHYHTFVFIAHIKNPDEYQSFEVTNAQNVVDQNFNAWKIDFRFKPAIKKKGGSYKWSYYINPADGLPYCLDIKGLEEGSGMLSGRKMYFSQWKINQNIPENIFAFTPSPNAINGKNSKNYEQYNKLIERLKN